MPNQIALIATPVVEITDRRTHRLVEEFGHAEILGQRCKVMSSGAFLEFWVGKRMFEISMSDLVATAAVGIEGHIRGEIRARVIGDTTGPDPDGSPDEHPQGSPGKSH